MREVPQSVLDALADAETLRVALLFDSRPVAQDVWRAAEFGDTASAFCAWPELCGLAAANAQKAARAAFRAVPGLRG
jgi:hypothetical protein